MKRDARSMVENLRRKAEELLKKRPSASSKLSEADILKLIHEFEVHQIEIEMQYEELILAREQAISAAEKYIELYDLAPSGYFTLSPGGQIIKLNSLLFPFKIFLLLAKFSYDTCTG